MKTTRLLDNKIRKLMQNQLKLNQIVGQKKQITQPQLQNQITNSTKLQI